MLFRNLLFLGFALFVLACGSGPADSSEETADMGANPPAEGFDLAGSDEKAMALADSVMVAMGGRNHWDQTRYIHWNFFGARTLLWDKLEQKARIESFRDSSTYIVDIKNGGGMVMRKGEVLSDPDSLDLYSQRGMGMWINDSYWLAMPYKLKDSGVTLKYVGQDTTQAGKMSDVLQLTFKEVGNTPNNKYLVYVDPDSKLVTQWAYFANFNDETPRFITPWTDYQQHGSIMLSGGRGSRSLTDIAVLDTVPEGTFTSLEPVSLPQ